MNPQLASMLAEASRTGWLHLSMLGLDHIPHQVFKLKNLTRLDLGYNSIEVIPDEIGECRVLTPTPSYTQTDRHTHTRSIFH